MIAIPESILKQLDKVFFDYLWESKPAKIKRSTITAPIELGGLAMLDVYKIHAASKCSWIRRLYDTSISKWKTTFLDLLNIDIDILNKNLDIQIVKKCKTEFHEQVLTSWINTYCTDPITYKDTINQFIIYNKALKINKKCILPSFFKNTNRRCIYNIRILNLLSQQNTFLNINDFNHNNEMNISVLDYNALKTCIPNTWKRVFLQNNNVIESQPLEPMLLIGNLKKPISLITSKDIYRKLIMENIKTPTAIDTWINIYPFLENYDWKDIYMIPFRYVREPYLQSFQYKIINRILNTNEKLEKWSIKPSNKCNFCPAVDTIEHHLYQCDESKTIWLKLENWLFQIIEIKLNLKECEILFGIPHACNEHLELINFVIIMTKWYINKQRSECNPLYFIELLNIIKIKIKVLILANNMYSRSNKVWQDMLNELI